MQPLVSTSIFQDSSLKPSLDTLTTINFEWLDKLPLVEKKGRGNIIDTPVTSCHLKGKGLYFSTCTVAGKLENRLLFIKKIACDVVQNCPKDEPLVFISLASGGLLMEYMLGKLLFENGFQDVTFFLIDPIYKFCEIKERQKMERVLLDFRALIATAFSTKWNGPFPDTQIRYLSSAQNVSKYLPDHPNVILMESLPPHGEFVRSFKRDGIPERCQNEYFMGNQFVPPENANAISFFPDVLEESARKVGATFATYSSLPYFILQSGPSKPKYTIDWGCKIKSNGSFFVKFFGADGFCAGLPIKPTQNLQLTKERSVIFSQWFPTIQQTIEEALTKDISRIQNGDSQRKLLQNEKTALLNKVQKIFDSLFPGAKSFYLADYASDRSEMIDYLLQHAGNHYRKGFTLFSDTENSFAISEQIL
ncbi:MAG: hypothetical protein H0U49_07470 [Parachlamydiaceae bacterium]|nr:hypothetical protein [Parachlamydiaceae bacterium]